MVFDLGLVTPGSAGTAEATPAKTYTAQGSVAMRVSALAGARVIRTLPPGAIVYPTGARRTACGGRSPTRTTMSAG